ncbi:Uncharacterised protein [Haemophilus influenzae]|uniref:hypothetical protein n=1 Tax=Haemophilus influenzae TaxID=727 RepID=UPI000DA31D6E|nr:hypothetical protein [Haemophilus influenzae]SQK93972.1 Uncharacterised protein [Haemophilus influenzae]
MITMFALFVLFVAILGIVATLGIVALPWVVSLLVAARLPDVAGKLSSSLW